MTDADLRTEIARLSGETLALQTILFWLLFHMERKASDPIKSAFDDAANLVEAQAIEAGRTVSPDHLVKALGIIEQFRLSIIRDKGPQRERP